MADQIKQVLGIDAAQALNTLNRLDQGFKTFETRLNSTANSMQNYNRLAGKTIAGLKQLTTAANGANSALSRVGKSSASAGTNAANLGLPSQQQIQQTNQALQNLGSQGSRALNQTNQAAQRFTITWETLSRVVLTQFIVRAMSQIRDGISEATDEAINFQRQVAVTQTIAGGVGYGRIAEEVRALSDAYNLPLIQTVEGVYRGLSNQVGDFGETLEFTTDAAKFARSTNSSLESSVNLLSGALKSFNLESSESGRVAGIFFTALEKGRITATELSNTLGRVGPAAGELGITLDEVGASIAAISISGLRTSEALTQLRGIINALTKPTVAMREALAGLGFESAEAGIATLRLDGLLEALASSTDGTSQSFAKLFPNIRGIGGALALTGDGLKTFAANIRASQQSTEDFANQKFLTATATDAEAVTREFNKLQNALTIEFGQAVLSTARNVLELTGGVDGLVTAIRLLTPSVITMSTAIISGTVALGGFKLAALAAASPITAVAVALGALALAAPAALGAIQDARVENALKGYRELVEAQAETLELEKRAARERLRDAEASDKEIVQSALTRVQDINRIYLRDVANARSANDSLVALARRTLDRVVDARGDFLSAISGAISSSQQQVEDSLNRIQDIRFRQEDRSFQDSISGLSEAEQVFALTRRSEDLAQRAAAQLRTAFQSGDDNQRQRALSLFQTADAAAAEAKSIAEGADNRVLAARAAKQLEAIAQRQIAAEQQINRLQAVRQQQLAAERDRQSAIVDELRRQSQIVLDNTGLFDRAGQLFDPQEQAQRAQQRQQALKRIAELAFSSSDFRAADALGLGNFVQSIQQDLQQNPIKLTFDIESETQRVEQQIRQSLGQIDVQLPFLQELEDVVGRSLRNAPDQIRAAVQEIQRELEGLRREQSNQDLLGLNIEQTRERVQTLVDTLRQNAQNRELIGVDPTGAEALRLAADRAQSLAQSTETTRAQAASLASELSNVDLGSKFGQLGADVEVLAEALRQLGEQVNLQDQVVPIDTGRLQELRNVLESIRQSNADVKFQSAAVSIQSAVTPTEQIRTNAEATAAAYVRAAQALAAIPAAGQLPAARFGRVGYFANGLNRGIDTQLGMFARGESIVSREGTQRFFSQIQAMNAGQTPVYRSEGGTTTTNIGDINVNLQSKGNSEVDGRAIARVLQRELRRKNIRGLG